MSAQSDIMPDRQEVFSSLYGAYRLAWFDESGMRYFNISTEGFWRSFFAAVLVAPLYMLSISQGFMSPEGGFSLWAALAHLFFYALGWIIFPLVAFFVTDLIGLGQRFAALVIAVNWCTVPAFALLVVVISLFSLVQQPALFEVAQIVVTSGLIVYHWFVIKTALETSMAIAMAFVFFEILLGSMLHLLAERLI